MSAAPAAARPGQPRGILHTIRSLRVDGVVKVVLRNLAHHDHGRFRHYVCALRREAALASEFADQGIEPIYLDYTGPADTPRALRRIRAVLRERDVALVHANRTSDLLLAGTAARVAGLPVVSTLHWLGRLDDHPQDAHLPYPLRWGEMHGTVAINRALAGRIVAVSGAVRDSFASLPGFPAGRTTVVYPGLDMHAAKVPRADAVASLRRELGLTAAGPVLLNVGRLQVVKGQRYLAPAMVRIRERLPGAVLLIAGGGELHGELAAQAQAAGLGEAYRLLGTRNDVDALLALADALILSSDSEAAPLPLFEAMRAGKPVVATNVGGVGEIVQDGVTGRIVPRADPDALAAGVIDVCADPARAVAMGAAARRLGLERFDIRHSVRAIESLYDELLG